MRAGFGLIVLLVSLAIVGWLVKGSLRQLTPTPVAGANGEGPAAAAPRQQVQAYQQGLTKAMDAAAAARASEAAQ